VTGHQQHYDIPTAEKAAETALDMNAHFRLHLFYLKPDKSHNESAVIALIYNPGKSDGYEPCKRVRTLQTNHLLT
jgi:hypothetical protein